MRNKKLNSSKMKFNLIFVFLIIFFNSKAQQENKIIVNDCYLKFVVLDSNNKPVKEEPTGKNVKIVYDPYFKSYNISYLTADNTTNHFDLRYSKTYDNGFMLYNDIVESTKYTLSDNLILGNRDGQLVLMRNTSEGDDPNYHAVYVVSK